MLLTSHPICDHFGLSQHSVLTSFVQMLAFIVLAAFYYAATAAVDCKGKSDKPYFVSSDNKYSLWPGLASNYDLANGDTLPGLESALEIIWRNQNPPDCSKAKYMITEPFLQGVGSEMHVYGVGLGMTIETGRVFLQQGGWSWRFKNAHCHAQNKHNMECYYMPLSKCTLQEAMASMKTINPEYKQPLSPAMRSVDSTVPAKHHRLLKTKERVGISKPRPRAPINITNSAPKPYLPPPLPRGASIKKSDTTGSSASGGWTPKADADLEAAVIKHGVQGQWQKIAEIMGKYNKTDTECLFRFRNALRKKLNTRGGPGPKGRPNFNDDHTMMDILLEGYGVVTLNRAFEATVNTKDNTLSLQLNHQDKFSDNVIVIANAVLLAHRKYVPTAMTPIVRCLDLYKLGYAHFWWRAIGATFFMRPNNATLQLIEQHSDPELRAADGKCVSAYVRHGDKAIEMELIPFQQYADTASCMWHPHHTAVPPLQGSKNTSEIPTLVAGKDKHETSRCATFPSLSASKGTAKTKEISFVTGWDSVKDSRLFYLGSEDPVVFSQARLWAAIHNINLRYSNLSQVLLSDRQSIMKHKDMERSMPANRQYEYFSYLLHLSELIRCRAMVCTLASNFCRLVDELRATVGGKAGAYMADLSTETCLKPPCVRPFSISDYQGPVYDPSDKLW